MRRCKMYKLIKDSLTNEVHIVKRLSDNTFIPFDEGNRDYQKYLVWISEGNTPEPVDE